MPKETIEIIPRQQSTPLRRTVTLRERQNRQNECLTKGKKGVMGRKDCNTFPRREASEGVIPESRSVTLKWGGG